MFGFGKKQSFEKLLSEGAIVIDVRSPQEFSEGNVPGSKNIPLQDVHKKIDEIKSWDKPVVVVCLSGGRSGIAVGVLMAHGIDAHNGGGWRSLV